MSHLRAIMCAALSMTVCLMMLAALTAEAKRKPKAGGESQRERVAALTERWDDNRELLSELGDLRDRREELESRLDLLQSRAEDARARQRDAAHRLQIARGAAARAQAQVDRATAAFVDEVGALSQASTDASADDQALAMLASADSPADAALVYATARTLIEDRQRRLDELAGLSARAQRALDQADYQQGAMQDALDKRNDAVADAEKLRSTVVALTSRRSRQLRSGRAQAMADLEALLADGVWVPPPAAEGLGDLDVGSKMVLLAQRELKKRVAEEPLGSNDSPDIARYRTATTGSGVGPWCAYFVSYIAAKAGAPVGVQGSGHGGVDELREWTAAADRFFPAWSERNLPRPGDIVFWDEHTGIVESYDRDSDQITTVEGNSSDRVSHREHPRGSAVGFARLGTSKLRAESGRAPGDYNPQDPDDIL